MKQGSLFQYLLAIIFFLAACQASQKVQPAMEMDFDQQGHRGCRGLMPENTLPAMVEALGLGVTRIELDVVITGDSQVLVSHEPWFSRDITTLPDGSFLKSEQEGMSHNIYRMSYAEIRRYDVGLKPHPRFPSQKKIAAHKPLLSEVFDTIRVEMMTRRRPPMNYNIELKLRADGVGKYHPDPARFVDLVMGVVQQYGLESYVNLQSFDLRPLQYAHEKYPSIPLAILVDGTDDRDPETHLNRLGFTPATYSPHYSHVTRALVEQCHKLEMRIIPWTVNEKEKIESLKAMGVDGIITDYPDLFQ